MMSDERIRLMLHAAADDCLSGVAQMPSQKKAVFDRIENSAPKSRAQAKTRFALVPVMILMLALASMGAAVGLGLFGRLRGELEQEMNYNRLGLLEEAAVSVGQTTAIGNLGELTIDQTYCDGNRLYYSYTLRKNDTQTSLYLGDGAKLADGTELPPVDSWIEAIDDFAMAAFYEVALPEGFVSGENVTILLTAIHAPQDGALELIDVPVLIPVTPAKRLTGTGTADGYQAEAALFVSDVDVYGTVRIFAPEEYHPERKELHAGEGTYPNLAWGSAYADGAHEITLRFDLPQSLENARLVLSDSQDAGDAIVLYMDEGGTK